MMKDDDFKLLRSFDYRWTDRLQTFVNVESPSKVGTKKEGTFFGF